MASRTSLDMAAHQSDQYSDVGSDKDMPPVTPQRAQPIYPPIPSRLGSPISLGQPSHLPLPPEWNLVQNVPQDSVSALYLAEVGSAYRQLPHISVDGTAEVISGLIQQQQVLRNLLELPSDIQEWL